jgi:hypothetical protein
MRTIIGKKYKIDFPFHDEVFIYHHLGLGDHISCHGIVRHNCEIYKKVNILLNKNYYEIVNYMFFFFEFLNILK